MARRSCAGREPSLAIPAAARSASVLTRPALADYIAKRAELAGALFPRVAAGQITIEINRRYALEDNELQTHRDLESGLGIGSSVLNL